MARLELESAATFLALAIKHCQRTKFGNIIWLLRSSIKSRVHICARSGKAVKNGWSWPSIDVNLLSWLLIIVYLGWYALLKKLHHTGLNQPHPQRYRRVGEGWFAKAMQLQWQKAPSWWWCLLDGWRYLTNKAYYSHMAYWYCTVAYDREFFCFEYKIIKWNVSLTA